MFDSKARPPAAMIKTLNEASGSDRQKALAGSSLVGVRRLSLTDFRSYEWLDLSVDGRLIVLTGDNGAGKTNLLEALSLLAPGRGLRGAELGEYARWGGLRGFAVSAELTTAVGGIQLGTGIEPHATARRYRVDREPAASMRGFGNYVRVIWLTPAMDGLFNGPPGDRRRFLDRLVLTVDPAHAARVSAFERSLRGRNRLLEEGHNADLRWLDAIEEEAAGLAVAIAAARVETVMRLGALIEATKKAWLPFPWAGLAVEGEVEHLLKDRSALDAEEIFRGILRSNRARDAAAGRALAGPQASDFCIEHGPKQVPAAQASTGEQKALLAGLIVAHAGLVFAISGLAPLVLLDEIAAHFDTVHREALFEILLRLDAQIWLSGADPALFEVLKGRSVSLKVRGGDVSTVHVAN